MFQGPTPESLIQEVCPCNKFWFRDHTLKTTALEGFPPRNQGEGFASGVNVAFFSLKKNKKRANFPFPLNIIRELMCEGHK